jgi:hypothetical protein
MQSPLLVKDDGKGKFVAVNNHSTNIPRRGMAEFNYSSTILASSLEKGEWSVSRLCRFSPGARAC